MTNTNVISLKLDSGQSGLSGRIASVRVLDAGDEAAVPCASARADAEVQALAAARQDMAAAVTALKMAAQTLARTRNELVEQAEGQMVELALSVARKVLMQEIQAGRYEIDPIVQEALKSVSTRQDVVVRLNPADLQQCNAAHLEQELSDAGLRFIADEAVTRASCLVETSDGSVEASVEKHLAGIEAALRNVQ